MLFLCHLTPRQSERPVHCDLDEPYEYQMPSSGIAVLSFERHSILPSQVAFAVLSSSHLATHIPTRFKTCNTLAPSTLNDDILQPTLCFFLVQSPPFWGRFSCPFLFLQRMPRTGVLGPSIR